MSSAEIIAVGTELLALGKTDTNSTYLTGRLAEVGISVHAKAIVEDDRSTLSALLASALTRSTLVIMTGGLGPTDDDLTREVAAAVTGRPLAEDPRLVDAIAERFRRRGVEMPAINRRQAEVPAGAEVLPNPHGSAPGLWFDLGERSLVLLPGPPREMRPMFDEHVWPRLAKRAAGVGVRRRVIKVTGRSESQVDEIASPIYSAPARPGVTCSTTILASPGQIELHLAATGVEAAALDFELDDRVRALSRALGPSVFSTDGRSLEEVVGEALVARGWRVAVAESCTGGLLLGRLTSVPGSSSFVSGGVVAYANDVKTSLLGVSADTLAAYGAVSEPVAEAMAVGARRILGTDVGVGITGIAGPSGGTPEKPVGTVVIAVSARDRVVRRMIFPGDRDLVRRFATSAALDMVRHACS